MGLKEGGAPADSVWITRRKKTKKSQDAKPLEPQFQNENKEAVES